MNLGKLFKLQKALDLHIVVEKGLRGQDLLTRKKLALQVELAELANEFKEVFKFWSNKKNNYENALVEFVDCLHFVLSIGLEIGIVQGVRVERFHYRSVNAHSDLPLESVFSHFIATVPLITAQNYVMFVNDFLALVDTLGFSWEEVEEAYMLKNAENHERQKTGY